MSALALETLLLLVRDMRVPPKLGARTVEEMLPFNGVFGRFHRQHRRDARVTNTSSSSSGWDTSSPARHCQIHVTSSKTSAKIPRSPRRKEKKSRLSLLGNTNHTLGILALLALIFWFLAVAYAASIHVSLRTIPAHVPIPSTRCPGITSVPFSIDDTGNEQ